MIRAVVVAIALQCCLPAHDVPCWVVRQAVARYGEAAVESWARAKGISDKEIEQAKRCLR
jgi:hypothetical protein